jgi:formylmethanofuran dehydrogenase subunit B
MPGTLVVAIPTFVASSLSFISCAAIAVLYWLAPPKESHPRHYMVWSLLLSGMNLEQPNLFVRG